MMLKHMLTSMNSDIEDGLWHWVYRFTSLISTKSHCFHRSLPDQLLRIPDVRGAEKLGVSSADLAFFEEKGVFQQKKNIRFGREVKHKFPATKTKLSAGKRFVPDRENKRLQERLENHRETEVSN